VASGWERRLTPDPRENGPTLMAHPFYVIFIHARRHLGMPGGHKGPCAGSSHGRRLPVPHRDPRRCKGPPHKSRHLAHYAVTAQSGAHTHAGHSQR